MSNTKSLDIDYIYINAMRVKITGHEVMIDFGMRTGDEEQQRDFAEKVSVVMLPFVAKALAESLSTAISNLEAASGAEISLNGKITVQTGE